MGLRDNEKRWKQRPGVVVAAVSRSWSVAPTLIVNAKLSPPTRLFDNRSDPCECVLALKVLSARYKVLAYDKGVMSPRK